MATACVAPMVSDIDENVFPRPKIPSCSNMGLDEGYISKLNCCEGEVGIYDAAAAAHWRCSNLHTAMVENNELRRRYLSYQNYVYLAFTALVAEAVQSFTYLPRPYGTPPPPYTLEQDPPPYDESDSVAHARSCSPIPAPPYQSSGVASKTKSGNLQIMDFKIDFDEPVGVQSRGKKKKAGKGQDVNWWEPDNEGEDNAGGDGGDDNNGGNGGGDGGSGAGGGGGDDNGGAGDGDDWDYGNSKKKKDKKKKKQQEEEEKKKDEEDTAAANPLSWADETNAATAEDEWATSFSSKKDKKKKGKKDADESIPAVPDPATSNFQDVSLDDSSPKLDFSFGNETKSKDSGGFGAWGKTWDFGNIGTASTTDKIDEKSKKDKKETTSDFGDNNPWSFGNKSKKKTTTTISSGFDFGDLGGNSFDINGDITETKGSDEAWGFSSTSKTDKKKKGGVEEKKIEPIVEESEKKDEETWGAWGAATSKKKDKKTNRKSIIEEELPPPPPPAPTAPSKDVPAAEDDWLSFGTGKKDKKKTTTKKSASGIEDNSTKLNETSTFDLGEPETTFTWGMDTKKDKKSKKGMISEVDEDPIISIGTPAEKDDNADNGDDWMNSAWGTSNSKKKDKKSKKGGIEDMSGLVDLNSTADTKTVTSEHAASDDIWGTQSTGKGKKDKKSKKGVVTEEPPPPPPPPPPPAEASAEDDLWGSIGKKDKKGKKTKGITDSFAPDPIVEPELVADAEPETNTWDMWGSSTKDKKKKEKDTKKKSILDPIEESKPAANTVNESEAKDDDIWGSYGLSSKDKKTKDKDVKKKTVETPAPEPEPESQKKKDEKTSDIWGSWGASSKDKKKPEKEKEKEKEKEGKKKSILEEFPLPDPEKNDKAVEDDTWASWGTSTKDKKTGKKSKLKDEPPPPVPTPPAQGLTPEPMPMDFLDDDLGGDTWGGLNSSKTKSSLKKSTTTKTSTKDKLKKDDDELLDGLKSDKKDEDASASKAVKSAWAFGTTTTSTTKLTKKERDAKAKKEAEEQAEREAEEQAQKEAEAEAARKAEEEEAAKKAKKLKSGKLSKTVSKTSDKTEEKDKKKSAADESTLLDLLDEPEFGTGLKSSKTTSKLKGMTSTKEKEKDKDKDKDKDKIKSKDDDVKDKDKISDDTFGFWGNASTTKKTAGKKDADSKKEITKQTSTNQKSALGDLANDLDFDLDFNKSKLAASSSKTSKVMNSTVTSKPKVGSTSVAARIKAFEPIPEDTGKKSKIESTLTKKQPALATSLSPKEEKVEKEKEKASTSKTKSSVTTSLTKDLKSVKKKDASSSTAEGKKSKDSVPGSFPNAFGDNDDSLGMNDLSRSKSGKIDKKAVKSKTTTPRRSTMDGFDSLVEAPEPPKLPTPPPEDKRSSKKERPRVERSTQSSWGFWGASAPTAKKSTKDKSKDDVDDSPPSSKVDKSPPTLSRSKSTRTPKEKEKEDKKQVEKHSKSSGSENDSAAKKAERPGKGSRGTSFSNFMFGGPPPSAMRPKPTRRSSTGGVSRSSSRRQSVDGGLMSPPPDNEPDMNDKAAKLMGVKSGKVERKASVKGKTRAVPDPYPIDDDDMVFINTGDNPPAANGTAIKSKTKSVKTKRESKINSKLNSADDDVVMVDANANGEPLVTSGPDDLAFVDHPPGLKRSNTAKKAGGFFGSLFGGNNNKTADPERERTRKGTLTDGEDTALPIRTKDKSKRRSRAVDAGDLTTDGPQDTDADVGGRRSDHRSKRETRTKAEDDDRAEHEARRKERRDREKADLETRRSKARDRARKEAEDDDQRREEKRTKRNTKDSAGVAQEKLPPSPESDKKKEERRRLRSKLEAEDGAKGVSKDDRRKSYTAEEEDRRRRREERKSRDAPKEFDRDREKDKTRDGERSSRKKSTPLMEEYHSSRNGSGKIPHPPTTEKASSWLNSQADDPPDIPPVEGTILDPSGEKPRAPPGRKGDNADAHRKSKSGVVTDEERRARRKSRRTNTDQDDLSGDENREKRKSAKDVNGSRKNAADDFDTYGSGGAGVTFDGRPSLVKQESKRKSFLGGFF